MRKQSHCVHCRQPRWIAGRGLCGRCYDDPATRAAHPSGKPTRREWTAKEVETLRALAAAGRTHAEIGAALGRPASQVAQACKRQGVRKMRRDPDRRRAAVAAAIGRGLSDEEMGRLVGCSRQTAARYRRALGHPPFRRSAAARQTVEKVRRALGHYGFHAAVKRGVAQAEAAGWPAGCTRGVAKVLELLETGPLSMAALAARLGVTDGTVFEHLRRARAAGWVTGGRKGKPGVPWSLAPGVGAVRAARRDPWCLEMAQFAAGKFVKNYRRAADAGRLHGMDDGDFKAAAWERIARLRAQGKCPDGNEGLAIGAGVWACVEAVRAATGARLKGRPDRASAAELYDAGLMGEDGFDAEMVGTADDEAAARLEAADELAPLLSRLRGRDREVVEMYYGIGGRTPKSMAAVGAFLGVSQSRVFQIWDAAMTTLKGAPQPHPEGGVS